MNVSGPDGGARADTLTSGYATELAVAQMFAESLVEY